MGLTGRTGAGCSTSAKILSSKKEELTLENVSENNFTEQDNFKFDIIKKYIMAGDHWVPFKVIEGSCVILSYVFENSHDENNPAKEFIDYLSELQKGENGKTFRIDNNKSLFEELRGLKDIFKAIRELPLSALDIERAERAKISNYYELYIDRLPRYRERLKNILLKYSCHEVEVSKTQDKPPVTYHLYTYILQKVGNNIRSSGKPYDSKFDQNQIYTFAERIDLLIKLIKKYDSNNDAQYTRICIDAIRNANESNYLKDKYRSYYLLSISTEENDRRIRLRDMNFEEQLGIDNVEYHGDYKAETFFYQQNIAQCFEIADIHIYNRQISSDKNFFLTWQLVKYITLMIHPGLITPTHMERCMQLAYNAKYNSGCLSRQVGAVVTGNDFSVKAVGWNDVPKGQLPCNLRDVSAYCKGDKKECFSCFEIEDRQVRDSLEEINSNLEMLEIMDGRKFPYCFKDVYNGIKKERNQVFTRSLHAEENAFLQISKYGGQGIEDGYLFCTASPCELCSKKAYQLGIRQIYYIDPYPGIAKEHIIYAGKKRPCMNLFYGAIGDAYISLYKPLIPYKDELELVTGVNPKEISSREKRYEEKEPGTNDFKYNEMDFSIEFIDREQIQSVRKVDFLIQNGDYEKIERRITWTGSSYGETELINGDYSIEDYKDKMSPFRYLITFNEKKTKGDRIEYTVKSKVNDKAHLMHPYLAHYVKHPVDRLVLRLIIPKDSQMLENVVYKRYADKEMNIIYDDPNKENVVNESDNGNNHVFELTIVKPNLFYTYSLEWEFLKIRS